MFATAFLSMALSVAPGPGGIAEGGHLSLMAEAGYPYSALDAHVGLLNVLEVWAGVGGSTVALSDGSTFFAPRLGAKVRVLDRGGDNLVFTAEGAWPVAQNPVGDRFGDLERDVTGLVRKSLITGLTLSHLDAGDRPRVVADFRWQFSVDDAVQNLGPLDQSWFRLDQRFFADAGMDVSLGGSWGLYWRIGLLFNPSESTAQHVTGTWSLGVALSP
jgi:hypothetical protein